MSTTFRQLNDDWNAEPNAPGESVSLDGQDVVLQFLVNAFQFPAFDEDDRATLRFRNVSKYRHGPTNDEGWYLGQCRFSTLAPAWGEFYEVSGELKDESVHDWHYLPDAALIARRRFLFYFRDNTFECDATEWSLQINESMLVGSTHAG